MEIHCAYDQLVRVSDLKPYPKNPNTHSAAQVAAIAAVIEGRQRLASTRHRLSNRSGFITRGHGRLEAALLLGCEKVPVDFQDHTSSPRNSSSARRASGCGMFRKPIVRLSTVLLSG